MLAAHTILGQVTTATDYSPKIQDIGSVYCGIAGMLNMLVVFDVLLRVSGNKARQDSPAGGQPVTQPLATLFINSLQVLWPRADNYQPWAVVPLVAAISVVYKGTKLPNLRQLPWAATKLTIQILVVMVVASVLLFGLVYAVNHFFPH